MAIIAFTLCVSGCSETEPAITAVEISVYDPFPPQDTKTDIHTLQLTDQELEVFRKHSKLLLEQSSGECDCGVAQFRFIVHYDGGETALGHFFHGPECLTIERQNSSHVKCPREFHDEIVTIIRKHDWMNDDNEHSAGNEHATPSDQQDGG